jgi:hypothetical protein
VSVNFFNGTTSFPISITHIGHQETGVGDGVPITLGAINVLTVTYTSRGEVSLGGTLSFIPAATPSVPEPATWSMLIAGFFALGLLLRRRRAQPVRLKFAA